MNRETRFVAYSLDPFSRGKIDRLKYSDGLNEHDLMETLKMNKVVIKFERSLETTDDFKNQFFQKFPHMKDFYQDIHVAIEKNMREFKRIEDRFRGGNIDFILIKSDGSFPHESDNLDMLIMPEKLAEVVRLLKKEGYQEVVQVREPHKFLFRKTENSLALHVHTRVEWEGTQFVDSRYLWSNCRISDGSNRFLVPSPEDCVLITIAHFFFENHEIKLDDLGKIDSCIRNSSIDWDVIFVHVRDKYWYDAFHLAMLLLNSVYNDLYGRNMLGQNVLSRLNGLDNGCCELFLKMMKPFGKGPAPLEIPYAVSGFFFVRRVLRDSRFSLTERTKHVGWVAADIAKRKTRLD